MTTLAILPEYQSKGYGKMLVTSREEYAKTSNKYDCLRFDAKASYSKLIKFHLKNKYKIVGVVDDKGDDYFLLRKFYNRLRIHDKESIVTKYQYV